MSNTLIAFINIIVNIPIALMRKEKYNSMPKNDREIIENIESIEVRKVKIKNPNNPVRLVDGV